MPQDVSTPSALTDEERARIRPLLADALVHPEWTPNDLRYLVCAIARRARDGGAPIVELVRSIEAELRAVARPETKYFDFDQVRERFTLWSHTVYRGR